MFFAIEKQNCQTENSIASDANDAYIAVAAKPAQIASACPSDDSEACSWISFVTVMAGTFAYEQAILIELAFVKH